MGTKNYTVTEDDWTLVTENAERNVGIQLGEQGVIRIHIGEDEPAADSNVGILIGSGAKGIPSEFTCGGLPEGTSVWIKSNDSRQTNVVVVAY